MSRRENWVLVRVVDAEKIAVGPVEAAFLLSIGKTEIYRLMSEGQIKSHQHGRRRLIRVDELRRFAEALPEGKPLKSEEIEA